jgi:long-chain acyl-CoA synthetase
MALEWLDPRFAASGRTVGTRLDDRKTDAALPVEIVAYADTQAAPALDAPVAVGADDPVTMLYTSGTTSHPKAVVGTHRNLCCAVFGMDYVVSRTMVQAGVPMPPPLPPRLTTLLLVPLSHATGLHGNLATQAWRGGTIVLMRRWDPEHALDLIESERVNSISGVPGCRSSS